MEFLTGPGTRMEPRGLQKFCCISGSRRMGGLKHVSTQAKVAFFFISLVSMACFAVGAILMAVNRWAFGGLMLLVAICVIGSGFVVRKRVMEPANK